MNCDPTSVSKHEHDSGIILNSRDRPNNGPDFISYNCQEDSIYIDSTLTISSCFEPHCNCPYGYQREDLDPCEYDDMGDYSQAVVCELNRISTNCSVPGLPSGCDELELCIKGISVPPDLLDDIPNSNPWKYCSGATDCGEWICPSSQGDVYIHLYLSVEHQDVLVDYAWDVATQNAPSCSVGTAIPYAVYFKVCYEGNHPRNCYNDDEFFCANMDIRLHVLYKCCSLN